MDEARFWALVEAAKQEAGGDVDRQWQILTEHLATLTLDEIIGFQRVLDSMRIRSYTNELWAAAYIINGGCSDDWFDYFRGWLIAQGREVFENALRDPETLVGVAQPGVVCEDILYVASYAYERKTGVRPEFPLDQPFLLTGQEWDDDDLPTMYPRLWAKFGFG